MPRGLGQRSPDVGLLGVGERGLSQHRGDRHGGGRVDRHCGLHGLWDRSAAKGAEAKVASNDCSQEQRNEESLGILLANKLRPK
jgi:hypothetical protein